MDVRRPPGVVVVAPRILAGPDGDEAVASLGIGNGAPRAREVRIERRVVLIGLVRIAAGRIRLPDLDQRVPHRLAVLIEYPAADYDALADRRALVLAREIVVGRLHVVAA